MHLSIFFQLPLELKLWKNISDLIFTPGSNLFPLLKIENLTVVWNCMVVGVCSLIHVGSSQIVTFAKEVGFNFMRKLHRNECKG